MISKSQAYLRIIIFMLGVVLLWNFNRKASIQFSYPLYGRASWYSRHSPGINERTANNEVFDDQAMTCALWGLPFHQEVEVTNLANDKSVVVRVNDRGPARRLVRRGRVIDLTEGAFRQIASTHKGLIEVRVEFVTP